VLVECNSGVCVCVDSRDAHKVALIYVAAGQEDKTSILSNSHASAQFDEFVAALGWTVNTAQHPPDICLIV